VCFSLPPTRAKVGGKKANGFKLPFSFQVKLTGVAGRPEFWKKRADPTLSRWVGKGGVKGSNYKKKLGGEWDRRYLWDVISRRGKQRKRGKGGRRSGKRNRDQMGSPREKGRERQGGGRGASVSRRGKCYICQGQGQAYKRKELCGKKKTGRDDRWAQRNVSRGPQKEKVIQRTGNSRKDGGHH